MNGTKFPQALRKRRFIQGGILNGFFHGVVVYRFFVDKSVESFPLGPLLNLRGRGIHHARDRGGYWFNTHSVSDIC